MEIRKHRNVIVSAPPFPSPRYPGMPRPSGGKVDTGFQASLYGLTHPGLEPTTYRSRCYYTTQSGTHPPPAERRRRFADNAYETGCARMIAIAHRLFLKR